MGNDWNVLQSMNWPGRNLLPLLGNVSFVIFSKWFSTMLFVAWDSDDSGCIPLELCREKSPSIIPLQSGNGAITPFMMTSITVGFNKGFEIPLEPAFLSLCHIWLKYWKNGDDSRIHVVSSTVRVCTSDVWTISSVVLAMFTLFMWCCNFALAFFTFLVSFGDPKTRQQFSSENDVFLMYDDHW